MKANPLVSIIIPVFNADKYLNETMESAINQTWPNKEILIIDDGSTDKSYEIAKLHQSDTVKVYSQKNSGASAARNYGLSKAKGDYIQFLDADDLLSPNKIEAQIEVLQYYPGFIGLCKTVHFLDGENPNPSEYLTEWYAEGSNDTIDFLIKLYGGHLIGPSYGGMIQPNAWLTPKSIIDKAGKWNEELSVDDDGEYFCRVLLASSGVKYSGNSINYYRKFKTSTNLSAQKKNKSNISLLTATQLKAKHLLDVADSHQAKQALSRLFWEIAFGLYSKDRQLSRIAENEAKRLSPNLKIQAFNKGLPHLFSKLIGWKNVKLLQSLK